MRLTPGGQGRDLAIWGSAPTEDAEAVGVALATQMAKAPWPSGLAIWVGWRVVQSFSSWVASGAKWVMVGRWRAEEPEETFGRYRGTVGRPFHSCKKNARRPDGAPLAKMPLRGRSASAERRDCLGRRRGQETRAERAGLTARRLPRCRCAAGARRRSDAITWGRGGVRRPAPSARFTAA